MARAVLITCPAGSTKSSLCALVHYAHAPYVVPEYIVCPLCAGSIVREHNNNAYITRRASVPAWAEHNEQQPKMHSLLFAARSTSRWVFT